jgi:putative transposase
VKGRKRHVAVDVMGLLIAVVVTSAGLQDDAAGAVGELFRRMWWRCSQRLRVIWADQMYEGSAVLWARAIGGWVLDIVRRPPGAKGFQLLPKRWVVERTFAWLGRYRRLSKDYEYLTHSSEAMIYLAMVNLMVHRLKPG